MKQLLVFGCNFEPYLTSLNLCHCLISNLYLKKPPWNCLCSKGNLYICTSPLFCIPQKSYLVLVFKNFKSSSTFQQTAKGFYPSTNQHQGTPSLFSTTLIHSESWIFGPRFDPPDLYGIHQRHCWSFDGKKYGQNHRRLLELELQIPAKPQMNDIHHTLFVWKSWGIWLDKLTTTNLVQDFCPSTVVLSKELTAPNKWPRHLACFRSWQRLSFLHHECSSHKFLVTTSTDSGLTHELEFPHSSRSLIRFQD